MSTELAAEAEMWNKPNNQLLPWMQSLSKRLTVVSLPCLHGENMWVTSDYMFGNKRSVFDVISVLLAVPEQSFGWESQRCLVRQGPLGVKRKMSFKSLGDRVRQKAFVPFLQAADSIHGIVITIAIDRFVSRNFVFGPKELAMSTQREWLREKWKRTQLDRMVTIAHFVAFLVAGLSKSEQNVLWISDQDDAFANERIAHDTGMVFTKFLNAFSAHTYGTISIGTTAITEDDLLEEDLAAITDVAAGGSAELLTRLRKEFGRIPNMAVDLPELSTRSRIFFDWFTCKATPLRKIGCVFEQVDRSLRLSTWT